MYHCLKQLYYASEHPTDYVTRSLSVLKSHKITGEEAKSLIAMHATAFPDNREIMQVLSEIKEAPRKYCTETLSFMEQMGVVCDCGNCIHAKYNHIKGAHGVRMTKTLSPEKDQAVIRWCLMDREFIQELSLLPNLTTKIKYGLLSSRIYLVDTPVFSFSLPIYLLVYQYIIDHIPYQFSYARNHGTYYGITHEDYMALIAHLLDDQEVPEEHYGEIQASLEHCLLPLDSIHDLPPRADAETVIRGDNANGLLEEAKSRLRTGEAAPPVKAPDPIREESLTSVYPLREEVPYISMQEFLTGIHDRPEIPMELVEENGERYLLIYHAERYVKIREEELQEPFSDYIIPICFLPFGILSYFPCMRAIRSLMLLSISHGRKQYVPGPLSMIENTMKKTGDGVLFQLSMYQECYEELKSRLAPSEREEYRDRIREAVYRSGNYFFPQVIVPAGVSSLFLYDGLSYQYRIHAYQIQARPGYRIIHITIPNLRQTSMGEVIRRLSNTYCTHSYFKDHPFSLIGAATDRNMISYVVPDGESGTFLDIMHLDLPALTKDLVSGEHTIQIQEDII